MVDRALAAVYRLPGPAEVWFVAAGGLLALAVNAVLWITGAANAWEFNLELVVAAMLVGSLLALSTFMRRTADAAFEDFRPALGDPTSEDAERHRLLSIPDRAFVIGAVAMVVLTTTLYLVFVRPTIAPRPPVAEALVATSWVLFSVVIGLVITQTLIQLRAVRHLSEAARNIDVLNSGPVDALSRVTAVGAVGLLVLITAANIGVPASASGFIALDIGLIVFALTAFVLPLQVMHRRLSGQKADLLAASADRLKTVLDALHRAIDGHDFTTADALNKMVSSAIAERDLLTRLPTWPWTTTTIRGFASALLLPVVIFVITRGIDRLF